VETKRDLPIMPFSSQDAWERWLQEHHENSPGVWLKIAKKDSGIDTVSYAAALEIALCYGWIDGQKDALDGQFWLQKFTPRGPRSKWSRINRDKVTMLTEQGRMQPAGLARVAEAQVDGRWDAAYESQKSATVPDDLQQALNHDPRARKTFESLDRANRYAILYRLQDAKRPETRARRLAQFVAMLRDGKKLHS
jgi:uncharacterized protein YdeI (YjbR/CyaY-like superfamily)